MEVCLCTMVKDSLVRAKEPFRRISGITFMQLGMYVYHNCMHNNVSIMCDGNAGIRMKQFCH